ncbi:hypothetical protein [Vibrio sp. MA40-2]|uniref:hypothetical protein n=1 Tax=Vibrio sp. MA40-2 TaxID=3391828 RepID=UPI0039A4089F
MTVNVNHPSAELTVNIPNDSQNTLIKLIQDYFEKSRHIRGLSPDTVSTIITTAEYFYGFLVDSGILLLKFSDIPSSMLNQFAKWCSERRTIIRGNGMGARDRSLKIIAVLNKNIEERLTQSITQYDKATIKRLTKNFTIQKRAPKKRPPMSQIFGQHCPFNDKQFLNSIRYVSAWLILEDLRQKETVLKSTGIKKILKKLQSKNTVQEIMTMFNFSHFAEIKRVYQHESHLSALPLLEELANEVKEVEDIYVKESFFRSISSLQQKTLSKQQIIDFSQRSHFHSKSYDQQFLDKKLGQVAGNRISLQFKRFTPFDLLYPTTTSIIAMCNLLASEKIQHSGIETLTLDDCVVSTNPVSQITKFSLDYAKKRGQRRFSTIEYASNDTNPLIYKAYMAYFTSVRESQARLPSSYLRGRAGSNSKPIDVRNKFCPTFRSNILGGALYSGNEQTLFRLIADKDSLLRHKIDDDLQESAEEYVLPFAWAINEILLSRDSKRKSLDNREALRPIYLNTEAIGNTRIVAERKRPIEETIINDDASIDASGYTLNSSLIDIARLTSHSAKTKQEVYLDRLPDKEKLDFIDSAPVRVAELMEIDAQKLIKMKETSKVFKVEEVKEVLGLLSNEEIYSYVPEEDIGLDGEIKHGKDIIYIATEENAALILRHIEYYKSEIPNLLKNQPEARSRIMDALLESYRLHLVIRKFPKNVVEAAKKIASKLSNELYPPLV